jgi:AcrR family transcriptional regulator
MRSVMGRPRSEAARAKMLEAAAELILTRGGRGFRIEEVARRSGVAKTTIYRHFPTPNELLVAAIDSATPVPTTPDTGTLRGDLIEFLGNVLPIFRDTALRTATLDVISAAADDPQLRELQSRMGAKRMIPLKTIFDRGRARGEISPEFDFVTAFDFMEGPFIVRSLLRPETLDMAFVEATVDRVLPLLRGGGAAVP